MHFKRNFKNIFLTCLFLTALIKPLNSYTEIEKLTRSEILEILKRDYINNYNEDFYIIGPGDEIKVTVAPDYPELESNTFIDGSGFIQLPKIKRAYVQGLTLDELNILLTELYKDYVKYPDVGTSVISYRPVKILVEGEVNNPGYHTLKGSLNTTVKKKELIPFNKELNTFNNDDFRDKIFEENKISYYFPTLFDVLRKSGGVTQFSDLSNVSVVRLNPIGRGGGEIKASLDLNEPFNGNILISNFRIYDGDIIKVEKLDKADRAVISRAIKANLNPKFIQIFVSGRVKQPGLKVLGKPSTLNDAIDISGGTRVIKGPIKYISYNKNGTINTTKLRYNKSAKKGSYKNPYLSNGDIIIVGESLLSNTTEFINEVTSPFQGMFSAYSLIQAISD